MDFSAEVTLGKAFGSCRMAKEASLRPANIMSNHSWLRKDGDQMQGHCSQLYWD